MQTTENLRVRNLQPLISPGLLIEETPLSDQAKQTVLQARQQTEAIIQGEDDRLIVVVGPCSIHDTKAALDYAARLKTQTQQYARQLCIIMRVYFEKPRTTIGWKGLINDPNLDGSFQINQGLRVARQLLCDINHTGLPTGSEFLDTIIPQYISDLTSWAAIGARTTESQIHRELASGLSMPVGFKNGTTGNIKIAVDAICAAKNSHHFLGVTKDSLGAIVSTTGNPTCHLILRGSDKETNYDQESIMQSAKMLDQADIATRIMVDCSHGNSRKDHLKQIEVINEVAGLISNNEQSIMGVMIESNIEAGKQTLKPNKTLVYGQSITDACIDWQQTIEALETLNTAVLNKRKSQGKNH